MIEEVGFQIKLIRNQQQQTLKQLSTLTGLSTSFLSQVERGESSIAITSLDKIAKALDVNITSFFSPAENNDFHVQPQKMKPLNINHSNLTIKRVSSEFENRNLETFIITLLPGDRSENSMHGGEEFYYMISGELTFYVNSRKYTVKEGEVLHYPSRFKHYCSNESESPATVLSVVTPKLF
ncbi:XRE family transcriptional regulator [Staphylococcus sp. IVB6181]|nr:MULTISPECIES: XRE family transcriptional regulator [unclassified Staphylococcus]UXV35169.1 XRE family transcriptional regulator [Staphylococcus sp. IVB6181]